jgi:hypothetical protein
VKKKKSYEERFLEFHRANPQVYRELVRFAREAKRYGKHVLGIRPLWERVRWELTIVTFDANSSFVFNDHYHSRYARLLMTREPDLRGMFRLRKLRTR